MKGLRPYVFYFPYHGVGGVPVLFLRIAEWLAQNTDHPLYIIDYEDGFMAKSQRSSKIQLLSYDSDKPLTIPKNSILIFQSDLPWGLPQNLIVDDTVTAFFWNCYPFNLVPVLPGKGRDWMSEKISRTSLMLNTFLYPAKVKCRNFLSLLLDKNALVFMDKPNILLTKRALNKEIQKPKFLPISLPNTSEKSKRFISSSDPLVGAWVGRIADFKINSLLFTLQKISDWTARNKRSFHFKIIGSGDRISELDSIRKGNPFLKIEFMGNLDAAKLNEVLINNVDILFAMGTSALEGARLAVPTVLLDFSYGKFPSHYNFSWIFETQDYSLGSPLDLLNPDTGINIDAILNDLVTRTLELKSESEDYFKKNHDINNIMPLFIKFSHESTFKYIDFLNSNLKEKPFYYKLWTVLKGF